VEELARTLHADGFDVDVRPAAVVADVTPAVIDRQWAP